MALERASLVTDAVGQVDGVDQGVIKRDALQLFRVEGAQSLAQVLKCLAVAFQLRLADPVGVFIGVGRVRWIDLCHFFLSVRQFALGDIGKQPVGILVQVVALR